MLAAAGAPRRRDVDESRLRKQWQEEEQEWEKEQEEIEKCLQEEEDCWCDNGVKQRFEVVEFEILIVESGFVVLEWFSPC